ncbi:tetratricopeptide repeat protein [Pyxidicoccus sp. 3LFB2]
MDRETSLKQARELVDSGAYGDAFRLLLKVLTLDPDDEEVLWRFVDLYEKKGDPAPVAHYRARIAELYASRGRDADALELLEQAVEHHQDPPRIRKRIAELQERTGQGDAARRQRWLAGEDVTLDGTPTVELLEQRVRARGFDDPLRVQLAEALLQAGRVRDAIPHFRQALGMWWFSEDTRTSDERVVKPAPGYTHPILRLTRAEVRAVREKTRQLIAAELEPGLERARRVVPVWTMRTSEGALKFIFEAERVLVRLVQPVRDNFDLGALALMDLLKQPGRPEGAEVALNVGEATAAEFLSKAGTGMACPWCDELHRGDVITVAEREDVRSGVITVLNENHQGTAGTTKVYCPNGHVVCDFLRWIS